jgi:hypothetical protein
VLELRCVAPLDVAERWVPADEVKMRCREGLVSSGHRKRWREQKRFVCNFCNNNNQDCTHYKFELLTVQKATRREVHSAAIKDGYARSDEPGLAQLVESHEVLLFAESVDPPRAKRKRVKILVDDVENVLGSTSAEWNVLGLELSHVVAHFTFLDHSSAGARASRPCCNITVACSIKA